MPLVGEYARSPSNWAANQAEKYEESGGTRANTQRGVPVVILTTKGRRSGALRKSPLMRVEHGGSYALIASDGGAENHPAWYLNLVALPEVTVRHAGGTVEPMVARVIPTEERALVWPVVTRTYKGYAGYQERTDREIPVVELLPVHPEA